MSGKKVTKNILQYLFEKVWKIKPIVRDHSHVDIGNWKDEPPERDRIKTVCRICGGFIGYRPRVHVERGWKTSRQKAGKYHLASRSAQEQRTTGAGSV